MASSKARITGPKMIPRNPKLAIPPITPNIMIKNGILVVFEIKSGRIILLEGVTMKQPHKNIMSAEVAWFCDINHSAILP